MQHRRLSRWISAVTVVTATAIAAAVPLSAHASGHLGMAYPDGPRSNSYCNSIYKRNCVAPLGYTGWTRLELNNCVYVTCPIGITTRKLAYRWDEYRGWLTTTIGQGDAYVQPFGGGYRWAWTQPSGWVAVSVDNRSEVFRVAK